MLHNVGNTSAAATEAGAITVVDAVAAAEMAAGDTMTIRLTPLTNRAMLRLRPILTRRILLNMMLLTRLSQHNHHHLGAADKVVAVSAHVATIDRKPQRQTLT